MVPTRLAQTVTSLFCRLTALKAPSSGTSGSTIGAGAPVSLLVCSFPCSRSFARDSHGFHGIFLQMHLRHSSISTLAECSAASESIRASSFQSIVSSGPHAASPVRIECSILVDVPQQLQNHACTHKRPHWMWQSRVIFRVVCCSGDVGDNEAVAAEKVLTDHLHVRCCNAESTQLGHPLFSPRRLYARVHHGAGQVRTLAHAKTLGACEHSERGGGAG